LIVLAVTSFKAVFIGIFLAGIFLIYFDI